MTSNHHGPYVLGYTRATMAITKSCDTAMLSESQKDSLSSDCGLQPAHMKSELLVIPNQHVGVSRNKVAVSEGAAGSPPFRENRERLVDSVFHSKSIQERRFQDSFLIRRQCFA